MNGHVHCRALFSDGAVGFTISKKISMPSLSQTTTDPPDGVPTKLH